MDYMKRARRAIEDKDSYLIKYFSDLAECFHMKLETHQTFEGQIATYELSQSLGKILISNGQKNCLERKIEELNKQGHQERSFNVIYKFLMSEDDISAGIGVYLYSMNIEFEFPMVLPESLNSKAFSKKLNEDINNSIRIIKDYMEEQGLVINNKETKKNKGPYLQDSSFNYVVGDDGIECEFPFSWIVGELSKMRKGEEEKKEKGNTDPTDIKTCRFSFKCRKEQITRKEEQEIKKKLDSMSDNIITYSYGIYKDKYRKLHLTSINCDINLAALPKLSIQTMEDIVGRTMEDIIYRAKKVYGKK